jgi:predicted transcriptional regulator
MKVKELVEKLNLTVYSGHEGLDNEIEGGYVSDLLSDVMGGSKENQIWVTLQSHKNTMAVASLKDLSAILLVKGFKPEKDTIEQSNEEGIPILGTTENAFTVVGNLFNLLNQ